MTVETFFVDRRVAVTEDHDVARRKPTPHARGATLGRPGVVHHADAHAVKLHDEPFGEHAPESHVVVPEHRVHRREGRELVEQPAFDHVAAVQDHVGGGQCVVDHGREPAPAVVTEMGVGEDHCAHANQ